MNIPLVNIKRIRLTTAYRSFQVLNRADKRKILAIVVIQISLSILDLVGVALIGLLGALSVSGIQSGRSQGRVNEFLTTVGMENLTFQTQAAVIGIAATVALISRTLLSVYFSKRTLYFLSRRCAEISSRLISNLLRQSLISIQMRSPQETLFAVTSGVTAVVMGIVSTSVILVSDFALLVVLSAGLFVVDPIMAIGTVLTFSLIGFALYRILHVRAAELGRKDSELNIASNDKILEVLGSYREAVVGNRRSYYTKIIGKLRYGVVETQAELTFMPSISKYIIESVVVIGALAISAVQFITKDAITAVSTLTVFMAAGTRIAPALLRIQQGAIHIKQNVWSAETALKLIPEAQLLNEKEVDTPALDTNHEGFIANISLKAVNFTYPNKTNRAISDIDLEIQIGKVAAFVGPSGAGKTTAIDIMLGVIEPDSGEINISGLSPIEAIKKWPGAIAYVPQDVLITKGSLRSNVSLGYPSSEASDASIMHALEIANLTEFVETLPNGIDTEIGERGTNISGGQRQRLGIARAVFTKPSLLVLDEATSALDGETESKISTAIQSLRGVTTIILIAHRLSTIREADVVYYLEDGKVRASGTFDEVRKLVPEFDRQAGLTGL
jgi:ABC-type multidrug transport system fused ATPase/permease subunit